MFAIRQNKPNSPNNITSISTLTRQEPPSLAVLAAFGSEGPARPLPGGQGGTWCADGIVLKRTGLRTETAWRANTLNALPKSNEFRIAPPVRSMDGTWTAGGWEAWRLVPGTADERRVDDVVRAGLAFHAALAELPRPAFLDERDDPWTRADRFSWGYAAGSAEAVTAEQGVPARDFDLVAPLIAARAPLPEDASQVVHGDLLGNVLFADADGLPPAIIDWPAYWRPTGWASAVAVVDALCWHGAEPSVLDHWEHVPHWRQLLVRALLFRIATHLHLDGDLESAYRPVIDLVLDGSWPKTAPATRTEPRTASRTEPGTGPRTERSAGQEASREATREATRTRPEPRQEMFDVATPLPEPNPNPEPQPQPQPQMGSRPESHREPEPVSVARALPTVGPLAPPPSPDSSSSNSASESRSDSPSDSSSPDSSPS
ncbi:TIGR02569 family protein [Streptomyces cavernicola]|uniref:TIGR02569 family protein n=1 Tax=Streptomyces cavernicola TaxID=3043613 RepID=A0ABT6SFL4_9ACTN|nr:TIGR02569 family protein [Streptomyces sp. B-S-A6]MDI3406978.1 TIGR02569 family protein [Streptomyces sp. B-S-A6]